MDYQPRGWDTPWHRWNRRAQLLIPAGQEATRFSASRIFAAVYPEVVDLACLIGSPRWRTLATGDAGQRRQFISEVGRRLGRPGYQPPGHGDAIAHWIEYDRPVLIRDWSPRMDGITATIWASTATRHPSHWTPPRPATAPAHPADRAIWRPGGGARW